MEYLRLAFPFGVVNRLLHASLRLTDGCFLLPFGIEDLSTLVSLSTHLLLHRVTYIARRVDVLQLYTIDLYAPFIRCFIEDDAELIVDRITARQGLI